MDAFLRELIVKKWKINGFSFTFLDLLLAVCITWTGVALRLSVMAYTVTDVEKLAAVVMDFVLAVFGGALVHSYTRSRTRSFLTYAVLVIYPTMVANSALWGRNSVFYAFLFFMGLYFYGEGQKLLGYAGFLTGGLLCLSGLRLSKANLTLGWPNIFEIIGKKMFVDLFNQVFLLVLLGLILTGIYCLVKLRVEVTKDLALILFFFLSVLIPYLAPSQPAWAGYTADIAALIYGMRWPKRFYLPMAQLIVSYSAYANMLNGETKLPMALFSVILLLELVIIGIDMFREVKAAR